MLKDSLLRPVLTFFLKLCFRVEISGVENFYRAGERVLVIANHQSYIDPLLLGVFLPEKPAFAINVYQAQKWYFRWLDRLVTLYRLDPLKPLSMKRLIHDLRKGAKVVLFPEGRITTSGGIMKIYEGAGMILEKTGATLLPVRVDGADYSKMSRLSRKLRQRWFPKIRLTFLPPWPCAQGMPVSPAAIYDVMTAGGVAASHYRQSLLEAMLEAYEFHGGGHVIASDIARVPMGYRQLFTRAFILSRKLNQLSSPGAAQEKYIAVMLPSAVAAMVTFFALHMLGRVPCLLNFSAGPASMLHACRIAGAKTLLTSRAFVEKAKLENVLQALQTECRIIYLEDIRARATLGDKLVGLSRALAPRRSLRDVLAAVQPDDPAVILYTSGSEGAPKGVALSHANILANIHQARVRLDLTPSDLLFNAMPVFHSFGLTVGMLLPPLLGIPTFLYPSPLHYRVIPDLAYDTDATVILGTDTFFNGYAHYAHDYDFWNIRLAVAGAEKLKEKTRLLFAERFGVRIMEGYGVTEASPVVSVNTPLQHKAQTVGRLLPAMEWRLEPVAGLSRGGRLWVKGPNVMLGYLKPGAPGVIEPQGEWYDTGDIVEIDAEGFITILGRAKRFAKIAGEMISLLAVEELAAELFPEAAHAAIAVADERKGEQIILFTEAKGLTRDMLLRRAKELGISELCLPRRVIAIEAIPRLGSGKIDYRALEPMGAEA